MKKILYKNKEWLEKQYLDNKLSIVQIGKLCNCSNVTIFNWLKKLNIQTRSCGEGIHLARGNHCKLSQEARQWIDGELLGDGSLYSKSKYSANFRYGSKYEEYAQYVSNTLNSFGIKQAGKINKRYYKDMDCYTYSYVSLFYEELFSIYKCWYPEPKRKKIIPRDLKLTPLLLRQEYIGDGSLYHYKKKRGRPYTRLATCGFLISDVEWFVEQLNKLGFKATRQPSSNEIHISAYSTKQFLEYIGDCPVDCYDYKWDY